MPHCQDRHIEYALADWLREQRLARELSQRSVAYAIGISHVMLHLYEVGAASPSTLLRWQQYTRAATAGYARLEIAVVQRDETRITF